MENEQVKLTAGFLNSIASGIVVTGGVAPLVAVYFGVTGPSQVSTVGLLVSEVAWIAWGIALHVTARRILRRLTP
jgi:hypothetical protein